MPLSDLVDRGAELNDLNTPGESPLLSKVPSGGKPESSQNRQESSVKDNFREAPSFSD